MSSSTTTTSTPSLKRGRREDDEDRLLIESEHKEKKHKNLDQKYPVLMYRTSGVAGDGVRVVDTLPPGLPIPKKDVSSEFMVTRMIPSYTGFEDRTGVVRENFKHPMNRTPLMTMLGTTKSGASMSVVVKDDCYPMFYAFAPGMEDVNLDMLILEMDLMVRRSIEREISSNRQMGWKLRKLREEQRTEMDLISTNLADPYWVKSVTVKRRKPITGFGHSFMNMLEIRVRNEDVAQLLVNNMASGVQFFSLGKSNRDLSKGDGPSILSLFDHTPWDNQLKHGNGSTRFKLYETKGIRLDVRWRNDHKFKMNQWIKIPEDTPVVPWNKKFTEATNEFHVDGTMVSLVLDENGLPRSDYAPVNLTSIDFEERAMPSHPSKKTEKPDFVDALTGPMIQVALSMTSDPASSTPFDYTMVICQGEVEGLSEERIEVVQATTEADLLTLCLISIFLSETSVLTGWYSRDFDLPRFLIRIQEVFQTEEEFLQEVLDKYDLWENIMPSYVNGSIIDTVMSQSLDSVLSLSNFVKERTIEGWKLAESAMKKVKPAIKFLKKSLTGRRLWRAEWADMGVGAPITSPSGDGDSYRQVQPILAQYIPDWDERLHAAEGSVFRALSGLLSWFKGTYHIPRDKGKKLDNVEKKDQKRKKREYVSAAQVALVTKSFGSTARGTSVWDEINTPGMDGWDGIVVMKKDVTVSEESYSLKAVGKKYFGEIAEVGYGEIPQMHQAALNMNGGDPEEATPRGNTILSRYCASDAETPLMIIHKNQYFLRALEMGRINGFGMEDNLGGQTQGCNALLLQFASEQGLVFDRPSPVMGEGDYSGALVFNPKTGYYEVYDDKGDLVLILDFASLYPSIMQARNACQSTILRMEKLELPCDECDESCVEDCEYRFNHKFEHEPLEEALARAGLEKKHVWDHRIPGLYTVKREIKMGIIPTIATWLKELRSHYKKIMKIHKKLAEAAGTEDYAKILAKFSKYNIETPIEGEDVRKFHQRMEAVYNSRQMVCKLVGNSMYGYLGAAFTLSPAIALAELVTTWGMHGIVQSACVVKDGFAVGQPMIPTRILKKRYNALVKAFKELDERNAEIEDPFERVSPMDYEGPIDEPCPFVMPEGFTNKFGKIYDHMFDRTQIKFKDVYEDFEAEREKKRLKRAGIKPGDAISRAVKADRAAKKRKRNAQAKAAVGMPKMTSFFKPMSSSIGMDGGVAHTSPLDRKYPPLFRSSLFSGQASDVDRFQRYCELHCWSDKQREVKPLALEDLLAASHPALGERAREIHAMVRNPDGSPNGKTFTVDLLEELEPPYVMERLIDIVYGDTDSIFTKFDDTTIEMVQVLGEKMELYLNIFFAPTRTMEQEAENVYKLNLLSKKGYEFTCYPPGKTEEKKDNDGNVIVKGKGLSWVRRDICEYSRYIQKRISKMLMVENNKKGILPFLRKALIALLKGEISMSQLKISNNYSKPMEEYKQQAKAHLAVVREKMRRGIHVPTGTRVSLVYKKVGDRDAKDWERAIDPRQAIEQGVELDYVYYVMNKILSPVIKGLMHIFPASQIEALFREVCREYGAVGGGGTSKSSKVAMAGYVNIIETCVVCGRGEAQIDEQGVSKHVCIDAACADALEPTLQVATSDYERKLFTKNEVWDKCAKCPTRLSMGIQASSCANEECGNWLLRYEVDKKERDAGSYKSRLEQARNMMAALDW